MAVASNEDIGRARYPSGIQVRNSIAVDVDHPHLAVDLEPPAGANIRSQGTYGVEGGHGNPRAGRCLPKWIWLRASARLGSDTHVLLQGPHRQTQLVSQSCQAVSFVEVVGPFAKVVEVCVGDPRKSGQE